uniref:Uncharacterized protein n=1 Tax=Aegilops tauschii subsp. strangulata TaxID=200361 RepID=A0A452YHR6_AEGTS
MLQRVFSHSSLLTVIASGYRHCLCADNSPCLKYCRSAEPTVGPGWEGLRCRRPEWPHGYLQYIV